VPDRCLTNNGSTVRARADDSRLALAAGPRVLEAVDELVAADGDFLAPRIVRELAAGRARLAQARCNLVVLGEFKRGKSTLINALLGREVLPTGALPLTSTVTIMRHGPRDRLLVRYRDGREAQHLVSDLARFVTEEQNPQNRLGVQETIVELRQRCWPVGFG
jgi:hypothetical protein